MDENVLAQPSEKEIGEAARSRVRPNQKIKFGAALFVWLGYVLVISSLMAGGTIGSMYPLVMAIPILLFAELNNAVFGSLMGVIGARTGLSTALISRYSYGKKGAFLPNLIMGVLQLGWYGVVLGVVGTFGCRLVGAEVGGGVWLAFIIGFGILFMIPPLLNIKWVAKMDYIAVPCVIILFFMISLSAIKNGGGMAALMAKDFTWSASLGTGISIAIGSWITGAIISADFLRYARNGKNAYVVMLIAFVACDFLEKVGAALGGAALGQPDLTLMLAEAGFVVLGFFAMLFATWSTEQNIIYSGALYFSAPPFPEIKNQELTRRIWVIIGATVGVIACATKITDAFAAFLTVISALVPPIFPVMAIDFWCFKQNRKRYFTEEPKDGYNWKALIATVAGIVVALVTEKLGIGISSLQGCAVSGIIYYIACKSSGMK